HGRIRQAFQSTESYFIARHTLDGGTPHCDAQKAFLTAWSNFYYSSDNQPVSGLSVIKDPSVGQTRFCRGGYAIQLQNKSPTKWAGHAFPRVVKGSVGIQTSVVLARGIGLFILAKSGQDEIRFDSPRYVQVALKSVGWNGESIRVYVPPGGTAWLLPIDNYYGEYTLAITNTSVGQRIEMWRAAWMIFLRHPVVGAGLGAYQSKVGDLIDQGRIAGFIREYDHPHNDYLNALASSGIVGLAVLFGILGLPIWYFSRSLRQEGHAVRAAAMAGLITAAGFAIYALTDTIFLHSMMITWYVVYMALFYAVIRTGLEKQQKASR
ncbi:MAG: O-antigen ligase family protein, partial [Gammaproteobacteria bacterium]